MTHLVYGHCGLSDPHFGVTLDCAIELSRQGEKVVFPYCDGRFDLCLENQCGNRAICAYCRLVRHQMPSCLPPDVQCFPLRSQRGRQAHVFSYDSLGSLKRLRYKGVWIGYAVLSSYISATRNSRPDFTDTRVVRYLDHALDQVADMTDWAYAFIDENGIEAIDVFNGRLLDNRALYDIAVERGLEFNSHEVVGGFRTDEDFRHIVYPNGLPHNLRTNTEMANVLWDEDSVPIEEKMRVGTEFFTKRRNNVRAGDRVYTKLQHSGELPLGFDKARRNIVVFNSSEDEFAAIGKDFEDYQLFASQTFGISYLLERLDSNYHVYVRVHPNLMHVKFDYVSELFELPEKFKNVTLIPPDSTVSTYALMDAAEKVVVFGSTTGAEATFAGKPVVLAGPSFYQFLDVAYVPSTPEDFVRLVCTDGLTAKPRINAVKYAYFLLRRYRLAKKVSYVDLSICRFRIGPVLFKVSGYSKLFGSRVLKKLLQIVVVYGFKWLNRWPLPEGVMKEHAFERVH